MTLAFRKVPIYLALAPLFLGSAHAADETEQLDSVTVFGSGQTRQINVLGKAELAATAPGSSPLKALEKMPGVNFQSADPFGAYEWSTKLTIRGFSQNQLGFTLDDVPLGDMSYRNHNGLHISRAISSENIGRVVLSQGTGALETASTSNLGGTIQFYSVDPSEQAGVRIDQTLGENSTRRTFVRADSGLLGNSTKFALSYTDQSSEKWKGSGDQEQQQFNAKLVSNFASSRLSAFVNYSSRKEIDYQDISKAMLNRLGYRWDNYYPNWNAAVQSANGVWTRGETSIDDAYYAGSGIRKDWLGGLTYDVYFNDNVALKTTVYNHQDTGSSLWFTPYRASSPSVPISLRTVEYDINRSGVLSALSVTADKHEINTGLWYEHNVFDQAMRFYSQANGPSSPYDVPSNPELTRWDYRFTTETLQFHLKDTIKLSPDLKASFGFKSLSSNIDAKTRVGDDKSGSIKAEKLFLPQVGINYRIDRQNEVFAGVAQNMRTYKGSAMEDSPFATTAAGFSAIKDSLKPETSTSYEFGWRYRQDRLETAVTAYHVEFKNRLLGIQQGSAIEGNPTVLANVGKVETNGIELGISWSPTASVKWFNSLSYNDSRYKQDFTDNGTLIRVSGKQVVDSPRFIASSRLSYDNGSYFGHLGANYVDKRYYTYLNDNSVDAYTLWDTSLGFRQKLNGLLQEYRVQLSVNNLFDKRYVASLGTNGFVTSDPAGTAQTLLLGAPRSAFVTFGASF